MLDREGLEAMAALIKALKGEDPKTLAAALAMEGTCLRCKNKFQWGKGLDIVARTITCPHCGSEIISF